MTDLTDRMRTCAAHMLANDPNEVLLPVYRDAAALLIEASNVIDESNRIDAAPPLGEPMEIIAPDGKPTVIIPPMSLGEALDRITPLPYHEGLAAAKARMSNPRACPQCDSRAVKRVSCQGNHLMLVCPVCAHVWPYAKKPPAEGTAGGQD